MQSSPHAYTPFMTECVPHSSPAEPSFAIRPFYHEQDELATDSSLPPLIHTDATQGLPTSFSPSEANKIATERRDSIHREATIEDVPGQPREKHEARAKSHHSEVTAIRRKQIQTMLLRCQLLQATILSLECRQKSHKTAAEIQIHHETIMLLARRALLLAQGLRDADLLVAAQKLSIRANAAFNDRVEAVDHARTVWTLKPRRDNEYGQGLAHGVTANKIQGEDTSLRKMTQRNAARKLYDEAISSSRQSGFRKKKRVQSRRDSCNAEQLLTVKDELDAMFECLSCEDGYGDLLDYLEDGEMFDPLRLLSRT
jgi:hypothetical protein